MGWNRSFEHELWVRMDSLICGMDWDGSFDHEGWVVTDHLIVSDGLGRII